MKKAVCIIISTALLMAVAGCSHKGIIPKGKMARIYADMYLMDQYAQSTPEYRQIADTCALYKFILADYGCTAAEFTASVDYYLIRSRGMKEILDKSDEILKAREASILKSIDRQARKQKGRSGGKKSDNAEASETDS